MLAEHSDKGGCPSVHPFPPCWGTHCAKQLGPSTGLPVTEAEPWLKAPHLPGIFGYQNSPGFPSDAPLLPCPLLVPSCSACPSSASGTLVPIHSPHNLRALRMHCGLTSSRAPRAVASHVLILPQNTSIVLKRAAGPGATKNPHLTFYFWFFPVFFPMFWCSRFLPQPSHSKPTCQPQPQVVDPVPGHRLEQEDEFILGICWQ